MDRRRFYHSSERLNLLLLNLLCCAPPFHGIIVCTANIERLGRFNKELHEAVVRAQSIITETRAGDSFFFTQVKNYAYLAEMLQ